MPAMKEAFVSAPRTMWQAVLCVVFAGHVLFPSVSGAVGSVSGYARHEKIKGQPPQGYIGLYEWDVWLGAEGESDNQAYRTQGGGYYSMVAPAGFYSLYLHQPEWHLRPKVVHGVEIIDGRGLFVNLEPATDYAAAFGGNSGSWGSNPWDWGETWHQTFIALGTSITHVEFKLAGTNTSAARISIHESNQDPNPENWPMVGSARLKTGVGSLADQWLGWRSGEIPTTPGNRYAVRLHDAAENETMGFFVHRDAIGPGYANGTAYRDGSAQPYDLYMIVGSDNDGIVIPYMKRKQRKPDALAGWAGTWGQTWVAQGRSLAGMDLFAAGGGTWEIAAQVRVLENGPQGNQIGPTKRIHTASWASAGIFGLGYSPGEVPLEPGRTYYIEVAAAPPSTGFSPYRFADSEDFYPDGQAYMSGGPQPVDLEMTIVEYVEEVAPPTPTPTPPVVDPGANLLQNGDMEEGTPGTTGEPHPDFWTNWEVATTAHWYGPDYGRNDTRGARVIGGSINGTEIHGGIYQRVAGLDPSKEYRFSAWARANIATSADFRTSIGYDLTGQTSDPLAATVVWIDMGKVADRWDQYIGPPISPETESISVWTRGRNTSTAQDFFADFDDFVLEEILPMSTLPGPCIMAR